MICALGQLASVVAFLASPDGEAIHGALNPVTGKSLKG